jgi:hypothetical protein
MVLTAENAAPEAMLDFACGRGPPRRLTLERTAKHRHSLTPVVDAHRKIRP